MTKTIRRENMRVSRRLAIAFTFSLFTIMVFIPLVSADSKYDHDFQGVNPWWYVTASVTGYYTGNPATFYDAAYSSWAYAWGWPICWKTAADTVDNNFDSYHAWSHCTGHFYSPAEGNWDCRVDADVWIPEPA